MSELGKPRGAWADLDLGHATVIGAVTPQVESLEDASGDVKAAEERLRSDVAAAQKRVSEAESRVRDRQHDVAKALTAMDVMDRAIKITSGQSVEWPGARDDREQDMAGVSGTVMGFEVGTLGGSPIEPPTAVIFHVQAGGNQPVAPGHYPLRADQAEYTLDALPKPEEEPAQ